MAAGGGGEPSAGCTGIGAAAETPEIPGAEGADDPEQEAPGRDQGEARRARHGGVTAERAGEGQEPWAGLCGQTYNNHENTTDVGANDRGPSQPGLVCAGAG